MKQALTVIIVSMALCASLFADMRVFDSQIQCPTNSFVNIAPTTNTLRGVLEWLDDNMAGQSNLVAKASTNYVNAYVSNSITVATNVLVIWTTNQITGATNTFVVWTTNQITTATNTFIIWTTNQIAESTNRVFVWATNLFIPYFDTNSDLAPLHYTPRFYGDTCICTNDVTNMIWRSIGLATTEWVVVYEAPH